MHELRSPRSSPGRSAPDLARLAAEVERLLATDGPVAALALLNGRTRFRWTGVYRTDPPGLHNLHLFDRENPQLNVSGAVKPLEATYCAFTHATNAPWVTADSLRDARLVGHVNREQVVSYGGVPLRAASGQVWGTLCHHDVRPRILDDDEVALLEAVAPVFARWLQGR